MRFQHLFVCALLLLAACSPDGCSSGADLGAPTLVHPATGWDVTDIALTFRWMRPFEIDGDSYETSHSFQVQVATDSSFDEPTLDHVQPGPLAVYEDDGSLFDLWTQISWMPPQLLEPGEYHWRVRVADAPDLPWSETASFTINADHSHAPLVRSVSPDNPIFSFDMFFGSGTEELIEQLPAIHASFPDSIRDHVALAIQNEVIGLNPETDDGFDGTLTQFLEPLAEAGVPVLVKSGGPDKDFQGFADLAELEHIFQTQENVLGILAGETFWDFIDSTDSQTIYEQQVLWYKRSFKLAAKYGRLVVFGNGNDEYFGWDRFLGEEDDLPREWMKPEEIQAVSANLILCPKNNIPFGLYAAESIIEGAWLAGMVDNWGIWSEGWGWGSIGYDRLFGPQLVGEAENPDFSSMPYNFWPQMKLGALARGATVYHFGGESSVVEWGEYDPATGTFDVDDETLLASTAFWDMTGQELPELRRYVIPFLEGVVAHKLIPSREEILQATKVAVLPGSVHHELNALDYGPYAPLMRATVGIDDYVSIADLGPEDGEDYYELTPNSCRRELLHNNGRYGLIPVLPYPVSSIEGGEHIELVDLSELSDLAAVSARVDPLYPEISTGDAWVSKVGDRIYINNSHENSDIAQDFSVTLPGDLGTLSGTALPHSYVIAKRTGDQLWILANVDTKGAYTDDRITRLQLITSTEPTVTSASTEVIEAWDPSSTTLSLELGHETGAVDLTIEL